jgi:hypothetical protein
MSRAVVNLVAPNFSLRELGPKELKGLAEPLDLFELCWQVGAPARLN